MFKRASAAFLVILLCAGLFTGCGRTDGSKAALTINGETVSAGTANTFIRYQQATTHAQMVQWQLIQEGSPYWDLIQDKETGQTYGAYFLQACQDDLVKMVLLRQHAEKYSVTISDEEKSAITNAAAKFISDNGSVGKWIGADQASVENVLSLFTYQTKMYDPMVANVNKEVSDDEAAQSTLIYFRLPLKKPDDYKGTDEAYKEEAKKQMQTVLDQAKTADVSGTETKEADKANETASNNTVSDKAKQYSTLASKVNSSIYVTSYSFGKDGGSLDKAVIEEAKKLTDGQFYDGVIETDSYLYLIKMEAVFDRNATDSKKSSIVSERQTTAYKELLQSWKDESTITVENGWNQLKVNDKESYVKKS